MAENKILELDWVTKRSYKGEADVSIRRALSNDKPIISISLRNDCSKIISNTEFIKLAPFKNRLFFKESDSFSGFKATSNNSVKESTKYIKVSFKQDVDRLAIFEGDYSLRYDDFYELYYIEREEV